MVALEKVEKSFLKLCQGTYSGNVADLCLDTPSLARRVPSEPTKFSESSPLFTAGHRTKSSSVHEALAVHGIMSMIWSVCKRKTAISM